MDRRTLYHIIQWGITLAACVFLVWKIATYDDYASLGDCLRTMGWQQWIAIGLCVALMPLNMTLEAWRWMTLMNGASRLAFSGERLEDQGRMSFREAHRQVYYSKLAGLITPWRLGEYPSRALLMARDDEEPNPGSSTNVHRTFDRAELFTLKGRKSKIWSRVLSMGAVGSVTMTAAIVIAGVVGLAFSPSVLTYLGGSYLYALGAAIIVLAILFAWAPRLLKRWAKVNHDLMLRSIGQSLVRLACWCVQLALVLYALGAISDLRFEISDLLLKTPIYYLLVTITPNVPIAEVGVRGAWAIVVFGTMNAALAGVLLWVINTLLPCVVWLFFKKK